MSKLFNNLRGSLILGFASMIWGGAFVVQNILADRVPPFMLNALRSLIGVIFLAALLRARRIKTKKPILPTEPAARRAVLLAGVVLGILLTVSVNLQQFGLVFYPEGTAAEARGGFLTSLYVLLVPFLATLIGKRPSLSVWLALLPAVAGIYLLCLANGISGFYLGDAFMLLCAFSFSIHILVVDRAGGHIDGILLSTLQFGVCAILSLSLSLIFEDFSVAALPAALPYLCYMGIASTGIGYTLQIIGQRYAEPTVASLAMSLESVFAALGGWLISGNQLAPRELLGCVLVFSAIVLAQIPFPKRLKKSKSLPDEA
jgi:drug/metabolite transporter (DMT)-like permease